MQIDNFQVESFPNLNKYVGIESTQKLRVCIATEEILGPVRNGGIASTYYHLAKGLAAHGHEVHVLYLKGEMVENETPEYWVEKFSNFGVSLHYLQHATELIIGPSKIWQCRYSAAYCWLREKGPFDVIHASEWRGGVIYALMAKKLGLAFQNSLFIIKTSSPHLWNRHYQMQPFVKRELLPASFAEQKCVEFADIVIGGSAHLLCFMRYVGYRLPATTYVQPNILDFSDVPVEDRRAKRKPGDTIHTKELTFFGRLEMRKGIEIFCAALDLLQRTGNSPSRVNFLGKYGEGLPNQNNEKVSEYIKRKSSTWNFDVECITDYNQSEALSFLCSRDMIAVMPSLIENSTMAVYEALENNIPFIATRVGGTPELIAEEDHDSCLISPYAYELAERLQDVLSNGHRIAHPSFDNNQNLKVWYGFHAYLADLLPQINTTEVLGKLHGTDSTQKDTEEEIAIAQLEVIVLLRESNSAMKFAEALVHDKPDAVKILLIDPDLEKVAQEANQYLVESGVISSVVDFIGFPAGIALARSLSESVMDACILCDGTTVRFGGEFCSKLRIALQKTSEYIITSFLSLPDDKILMPMGSDIVSEVACGNSIGTNVFCIPSKISKQVGPLLPYDIRYGLLQEYVLRAYKEFSCELMVIPETYLKSDCYLDELEEAKSNANSLYLRSMSLVENSDIAYRKLALLPAVDNKLNPALYRDKNRHEEEPVWLAHSDRPRKMRNRNARVVIGLDEKKSHILCVAKGKGTRKLIANGEPQPISLVIQDNEITLHRFSIPDRWDEGDKFNIKFLLEDEENIYTRFIRVIKLSKNVFAAISGSPILNQMAIEEIFKQKDGRSLFPAAVRGFKSTTLTEDKVAGEEAKNKLKSTQEQTEAAESEVQYEYDIAQVIYEQNHKNNQEIKPRFNFPEAVKRSGSTFKRIFKGYTGSPIKGSIPPRELFAIDPHFLEGWAWDRSNISRNLVVVLELNGYMVAETTANQYIERFGSRNPKLAWYGFRFALTEEIKQEYSEITIRIKENGLILRNGRLRYLKQMLVAM
ncbi:glycosyltransferase family 4 protein [Microbulbifer sp. ZKSA006]|uniref:glycosyltransferase family 4 protein n=1 Tax=Microbulbifer sp. ZKSA006 TaxID=3243390 RepID=UPI004039B425